MIQPTRSCKSPRRCRRSARRGWPRLRRPGPTPSCRINPVHRQDGRVDGPGTRPTKAQVGDQVFGTAQDSGTSSSMVPPELVSQYPGPQAEMSSLRRRSEPDAPVGELANIPDAGQRHVGIFGKTNPEGLGHRPLHQRKRVGNLRLPAGAQIGARREHHLHRGGPRIWQAEPGIGDHRHLGDQIRAVAGGRPVRTAWRRASADPDLPWASSGKSCRKDWVGRGLLPARRSNRKRLDSHRP